MVKITAEMKNIKQKRIDYVCSKVDESIRLAVKEGKNIALFACDMDADSDVHDEIVAMYRNEGYKIIPYGCCGGVWQRAENIIW